MLRPQRPQQPQRPQRAHSQTRRPAGFSRGRLPCSEGPNNSPLYAGLRQPFTATHGRRQLSLSAQRERDTWYDLLAWSLDAQGRSTEAAACCALAIDAVVAQLLVPATQ